MKTTYLLFVGLMIELAVTAACGANTRSATVSQLPAATRTVATPSETYEATVFVTTTPEPTLTSGNLTPAAGTGVLSVMRRRAPSGQP